MNAAASVSSDDVDDLATEPGADFIIAVGPPTRIDYHHYCHQSFQRLAVSIAGRGRHLARAFIVDF